MQNILHLITGITVPNAIKETDAIVLLRDGIYLSLSSLQHNNLYVLEDDLLARGLSKNLAKTIDYCTLVGLTVKYTKIITWN